MTLEVNTSASIKELVNEAIEFTKYSNDFEAMEYLNSILTELKYKMSFNSFEVFMQKINTMLNA